MKKIEHMKYITRAIVQANPEKIFLFGDNLIKRGYGGQAKEMRDEPNAIGIPTKKRPSTAPDSFFTDDEYNTNIKAIDDAFNSIPPNHIIVLPTSGLGTGLADMPQKAPKTFLYLCSKLMDLQA